MRLPRFNLDEYLATIRRLQASGYTVRRLGRRAATDEGRSLYLRHDVDFDPRLVTNMARAEAAAGLHATYYVMLSQHYNAMELDTRRAIRLLGELGHSLGLHYDMRSYPDEAVSARRHLDWEVGVLADLAQQPVTTIVMHHPSAGQRDPFEQLDDYLHPHDPRYQDGLVYISDSCRAWRDTSLLHCMEEDGPKRLLLNTHPELWLDGSVSDRMAYLGLLRDAVNSPYRDFFDTVVREAWSSHPGATSHDEREHVQELPPPSTSRP